MGDTIGVRRPGSCQGPLLLYALGPSFEQRAGQMPGLPLPPLTAVGELEGEHAALV